MQISLKTFTRRTGLVAIFWINERKNIGSFTVCTKFQMSMTQISSVLSSGNHSQFYSTNQIPQKTNNTLGPTLGPVDFE